MTSFSFTTGNPNNLVANQNASMADIQGPFTDLRTFLNGGTMDETNVPNLSAAFTTYKRIARGAGQLTTTTGTFLLSLGGVISGGVSAPTPGSGSASVTDYLLYLDPSIYSANSRTTKLQLRVTAVPGTVTPTLNYTAGLYPVATYSGANPVIATVGTVVAGSTATVTSPPATTLTTATSSDFNFPSAGGYVLGVVPSTTAPGGTIIHLIVQLEMRQV